MPTLFNISLSSFFLCFGFGRVLSYGSILKKGVQSSFLRKCGEILMPVVFKNSYPMQI